MAQVIEVAAYWSDGAYCVRERGRDWTSADGDEWVGPDGRPVESDDFAAARISLHGGPCDGKVVN